jgi:hypothetical protein
MDYAKFSTSRLNCVIGNNVAWGEEHRAWYNGIFEMTSPDQPETVYVPSFAGFNLENFFDARPRHEDNAILFEPRAAAMEFQKLDDQRAELYQPETPYFGIESWTRFTLNDPYYIDVEFRCIPHREFVGGFFGIFWASYINAPLNKSMYFLGKGSNLDEPLWMQYCTQQHDRDSTVPYEADTFEAPYEPAPTVLWNQISPLRYSEPFFYGRYRNMVLIYVFEPNPYLRLSHSPSGGGLSRAGDTQCPAWDFQMVIPEYQVGAEYGLRARVVYKPWVDRADVIDEVRRFLG